MPANGLFFASAIRPEIESELCVLHVDPLFRSLDTLLESPFVDTKSSLPSPLKSPTATESVDMPTAKLVAAPKLPVPGASKVKIFGELSFGTARSSLPGPLKSPSALKPGH